MKIAISADCLNVFTSGFPVRGMLLEIIKQRKNDTFVLFYTNRPIPSKLADYYDALHKLPNVEIRYFKNHRKIVGLKRFLTISTYLKLDNTYDLFWNPSYLEYLRDFKGPQLANLTDLSILKGHATIPHKNIWRIENYFAKKFYFSRKNLNIATISNFTKKDVFHTFKDVRTPINVIYNGISDFWFDDLIIENDVTSKFSNTDYFIWWGYVSRRKNVISMIEAYYHAKKEVLNIPSLLLVGDIAPHMRPLMNEYIENGIFHIPFVDDYTLKTLVRNSNGLIFPSYYEGFGLPVIEAYSQGVPVVCSNVTSLPEISKDYAIFCNPFDIISIKNAIIKLAKCDHNNSDVIKSYARQFNYKTAAKKYSNLIDKIQ